MTRDATSNLVGSDEVVDAAILVTDIEEVFVASIVCEGAIVASSANIRVFKEGISGTASMMKSAVARSDREVVGSIKDRASSASSLVIRDLETSFCNRLSEALVSQVHVYNRPHYLLISSLCLEMAGHCRPT